MSLNSADRKRIAERDEELKRNRRNELEDVRKIVSTKEGERFFKRLFALGKMFETTFTGNSQTFFYEGHRNFALIFLNDVCEAMPEKIPELMKREQEEIENGRPRTRSPRPD